MYNVILHFMGSSFIKHNKGIGFMDADNQITKYKNILQYIILITHQDKRFNLFYVHFNTNSHPDSYIFIKEMIFILFKLQWESCMFILLDNERKTNYFRYTFLKLSLIFIWWKHVSFFLLKYKFLIISLKPSRQSL